MASLDKDILKQLERRLGRLHARQRLGIESESEPKVFGHGFNFFHPENWYSSHRLIKNTLQLTNLYRRGKRNTLDFRIKHNDIYLRNLPTSFNDFTILHLSDLHVDMNWEATHTLIGHLPSLKYDLCVLTGDYRAQTYGTIEGAIKGMQLISEQLKGDVYGVLGNHDSIRMLPSLENMNIRMLLNESVSIERNNARLYIAGIDDAHYFRVDNIAKAAEAIPDNEISILLSHTPEIYRQAAHCDFDVILCGHTHGGQICLPGGIPITLDSRCPRYMGKGPWQYYKMQGYTSVGAGTSIVSVRFNCPPEITLHHLKVKTSNHPK